MGCAANQPKKIKLKEKHQKEYWDKIQKLLDLPLKGINGNTNKLIMAKNITQTPFTLSGIDLSMP